MGWEREVQGRRVGRCRVGGLVCGGRCRVGGLVCGGRCRVGRLVCGGRVQGRRVGEVRPPSLRGGPLHLCTWSRASEPIFSKTHTNEFCGIEKCTPEPAGPCAPLRPGRWVYEKGSRKPCGGDVERLSASAPLRGSLRRPLTVPFLTSPPSRGALRSAGVPTIAASTTPAPLLPWRIRPGPARHLGRLRSGAREYPICAEGWAMWVFGGSPYLFKATGGTYRLGTPQG